MCFPAPSWNFCKYLVDKNGKVLQEFPSKVKPDDKELTDAIDAALSAPTKSETVYYWQKVFGSSFPG